MEMTTIARLNICGILVAALLGASTATAQERTERAWRHAIIEPKGDAGFQVMAVRGGFATRQGLKLELPAFQNDVIALRGLLAGELESYEGGAATAIIAGSRNADVKILGCHWQTVVHSVFARAELNGPQDLKGHTMAISTPNATPDMIGRAYLTQNNVPMSEVKFASLGNDPDRFKAMLSGIALATVISIEFLPIAEKSGIKLVARGGDVMPKYQRLCTVTTGKLIAARRDDVIGFLTAQMQGLRHALASPEEEIRITREITGMKADDPRPEFMFKEASRPATGIDPTMPLVMDKLEWLQGELVKAGNLSQPSDLARIVDADIRKEALARAGLPQ
jgi:NitT/TauT family transport system substrate-binding protein